jgi:predicted NUDIX family phosphoesterase
MRPNSRPRTSDLDPWIFLSLMNTRILGFPAEVLDRLGRFQGFSADVGRYLPAVFERLGARERGPAEEDPSFKQLIPYVVFVSGKQVFRYVRGKRGSEARLHELHSIGVGGHIEATDVSLFGDTPGAGGRAAPQEYDLGMRREIAEEVILPEGEEHQHAVGLINDDSTPVGRVHFGVVHLWELPAPELKRREAALARAGFAPLDELLAERDRFETWSQFVLDWLKGN